MNALLFSLPGTPVIYYGDEIGMGDNIYLGDRNGVRTPMQWSGDRNAGFSRANPQRLYLPIIIDPEYHYEAVNVETQQNNASSLLWWMKRLIGLRKRFQAFGRGTLEFLRPANPKILAFVRKYQDERILVVANLSRFVQFAELDLREYAGVVPEEVFGRTAFPRIGELPYLLTLGPHSFFWFSLPVPAPVVVEEAAAAGPDLPVLPGYRPLAERFDPVFRDEIEALLPEYLTRLRLGRGGSPVVAARIQRAFPVSPGEAEVWFLLVHVEFREGVAETVTLPLAFVHDDNLAALTVPVADAGFARIAGPVAGVLCDALAVPACSRAVLRNVLTGRLRIVEGGEIVSAPLARVTFDADTLDSLPLSARRGDRNTLTVVYGEEYVLKTFRHVEEGLNPALEVGRFLAGQPGFTAYAPVIGSIEYRRRGTEPATLAVLYGYVPNQGTAWQSTLDELSRYFERVAALSHEIPPRPPEAPPLMGANGADDALPLWHELAGGYLESARLLGRRTAELHAALTANPASRAFAVEPFGKLYQRSLYQTMRNLTGKVCRRLQHDARRLPEPARDLAARVVAHEEEILRRFRGVLNPALGGSRIRVHGDYHLGRLLHTGKDFILTDFEGDPDRTIEDRRVKRSPLRDVASMVRSFDYAVQTTLLGLTIHRGRAQGVIRAEDLPKLEPWAEAWYHRVSREYVAAYLEAVGPLNILPPADDDRLLVLDLLMLEKAMYEIESELEVESERVVIPLRGVIRMIGAG
jgi:maltose alpha-D-glucosyltransferase/alpha-amylase